MNLAIKIILALLGLGAALGLAFYLWLLYAYTPSRPGPNTGEKTVLRSADLDGVVYEISAYTIKPGDPPTYTVAAGLAKDETGPRALAWTTGKPVPVDVHRAGDRRLEVVFDGPLADGATSIVLDVEADYSIAKTLVIENGRRIDAR